jgi:hypothetical protein
MFHQLFDKPFFKVGQEPEAVFNPAGQSDINHQEIVVGVTIRIFLGLTGTDGNIAAKAFIVRMLPAKRSVMMNWLPSGYNLSNG